jgi:hypothetical protein
MHILLLSGIEAVGQSFLTYQKILVLPRLGQARKETFV